MTVEIFVRIVWKVFAKIKKSRKWLFLAIFGLILALFLFGCRMTVQNFMKIVWTVFEKFEIFMKRSEEKKRHDYISSRKFFPTPKLLKTECYNFHVFCIMKPCHFSYFSKHHSKTVERKTFKRRRAGGPSEEMVVSLPLSVVFEVET